MTHIPYKDLSPVRQLMHDILRETVHFFIKNPEKRAARTLDDGRESCFYSMPDGRRCAVGRYLQQSLPPHINGYPLRSALADHIQEKYKEVPADFWRDLQRWHDSCFSYKPHSRNQLLDIRRKYIQIPTPL